MNYMLGIPFINIASSYTYYFWNIVKWSILLRYDNILSIWKVGAFSITFYKFFKFPQLSLIIFYIALFPFSNFIPMTSENNNSYNLGTKLSIIVEFS